MKSNPNIAKDFPDEITLYKKVIDNEVDPIKREMFSFSEVVFIMNNIEPFSIGSDEYFETCQNEDKYDELIENLSKSYLAYRKNINTEEVNLKNLSKDDTLTVNSFIHKFFDLTKPIRDNKIPNLLWIYPKVDIRKFLSECLINNSYSTFYYDNITLQKLILVMVGFVKYEYLNADENIVDEINKLNYPTLVLANINLYEKGIIKLLDEDNGIGVTLDLNPTSSYEILFTKNIQKLKKSIIEVLNEVEKSNYSISDFLD